MPRLMLTLSTQWPACATGAALQGKGQEDELMSDFISQ
jgi:hypothetical protein